MTDPTRPDLDLLLPPALRGRLSVLDVISRGAGGDVLNCHDRELDRRVVYKGAPVDASDPLQRRLVREAKLLAETRHPGVLRVLQVGGDGDASFVLLEYLHGPNLEEVVRARGPLPVDEALGLVRRIAEALDVVHRTSILHRDLKPANVVLVADRGPVVIDFGLAYRDDQTRITQSGDVLGTPAYLAPELALGEAASVQSDLYALGLVLHYLLLGRPTFSRLTVMDTLQAQIEDRPEPIPGLPEGVYELLDRLVAKVVADRPASAAEVVALVDRVIADPHASLGPVAPVPARAPLAAVRTELCTVSLARSELPASPPGSATASPRAWRRAIAGVALLVIMLGLVAASGARTPVAAPGAGIARELIVAGRWAADCRRLAFALPSDAGTHALELADARELAAELDVPVPGQPRGGRLAGPGAALGGVTVNLLPGRQRVRVLGLVAAIECVARGLSVAAARESVAHDRAPDAALRTALGLELARLPELSAVIPALLNDPHIPLARRLTLHRTVEELHGPFRGSRAPELAPLRTLGTVLDAWIPRTAMRVGEFEEPPASRLLLDAPLEDEGLAMRGASGEAARAEVNHFLNVPRRVHAFRPLRVLLDRAEAERPMWIVLLVRRLGERRYLDIQFEDGTRVRVWGAGPSVEVSRVLDLREYLEPGGRDRVFPPRLLRVRLPAGIFREGPNRFTIRAGTFEASPLEDSYPVLTRVWAVPDKGGS